MKKYIVSLITAAIITFSSLSHAVTSCTYINGDTINSPGNAYGCGDYGKGNCVWWAGHKRPDLNFPHLGVQRHGKNWLWYAEQYHFPTSQTPVQGAIMVIDQYKNNIYGHVAYVESVSADGTLTVSEQDNFGSLGTGVGTQTGIYVPASGGYKRYWGEYLGATIYPVLGFISPTRVIEYRSEEFEGALRLDRNDGQITQRCEDADRFVFYRSDINPITGELSDEMDIVGPLESGLAYEAGYIFCLEAFGLPNGPIDVNLGLVIAGKSNFELVDNGTGGGGPGGIRPHTDPASNGYPDFITTRVELHKNDVEGYRYLPNTDVDAIVWIQNIGDADWAPDEDGKLHDDIEVRYYLSEGYKEDSHSEWQRTGSEIIQQYNLELGDPPKKETDGFTTPSELGIYNIVVCADRIKDSDNKDGDVLEKHKSNNCSTEAVFEVVPYDLDVFDFWRAHNPIYATGGAGYDNFEARFKIRNNAAITQYIEDMRIDAYRNGSFELTCWHKDGATTIGSGQIYELDKKFCEIEEPGEYHLEAKLKIGGVWRTNQTHPSFDILPALDLEILNFYQKPEPIYATYGSGTMNFYAGLAIKNNTSVPAIFKWLYIEAYRDGLPIFQCYKKTTETILQPGEVFDTGHNVCDFWNPGEYELKLVIHLDSAVGWRTFSEFPPFRVIDTGSSYSDLRVPSLSTSKSSVSPGEQINLSALVKNFGSATSPSSTVNFVLSNDSLITQEDSLISQQAINSLSANNQANATVTNVTSPITPGVYWIGACVNPVSNESAIQNNCSSGQQITVINTYSDLVVTCMSWNSPQLINREYESSFCVYNNGNKSSNPTTVNVSFINGAYTFHSKNISIPLIAPQDEHKFEVKIVAPNLPGDYIYSICVSADNDDADITNNCMETYDKIMVNHSDLDLYEFDDTPQTSNRIMPGETQQHNIIPAMDEDWVWFNVDNQSEIILEISGQSGDTLLTLYNQSLTEIAQNDNKEDGSLFSKITIPNLTPGKYYAHIMSLTMPEIPNYSLTLTINNQKLSDSMMPIIMYLLDKDDTH